MKKVAYLWCVITILVLAACGQKTEEAAEELKPVELSDTQMRAICELATMECYYHNVAKFSEKDAEGFLFWKKDKHFWIEYSGTIRLGIDASKVEIDIQDNIVTITMPKAKVLSAGVDKESLTEDAFIVASDSAKLTAEDATQAYREAQIHMEETASKDETLLSNAQRRAQKLLEDYVKNMGELTGTTYRIQWKYLKEDSVM